MSREGLAAAEAKMRAASISDAAIEVFRHYYAQLESGETGVIREADIEPMTNPPQLDDVEVTPEQAREALGKMVLIKLNGGLGTSMGLDRAKSLLPVRDGLNFLDLVVKQVRAVREEYGVRMPLLLLDSFRTQQDAQQALAGYPDLAIDGLPMDILQNQEPKLRADDLTPVQWPDDPTLEWCPPGHGDLYPALLGSGVLKTLLEQGFRYASVSNGDNLGAAPDPRIVGWFAQSGAPYAAEVCVRTINDRKGGHLAVRKADGQLILRDTAQTSPDEMDFFTDEHRHRYFHTNNLWFDLQVLYDTLTERKGVLGLPLIRNEKPVDPSQPDSPRVVQIESAMGAAIEVFPGATAICVGRDRFLPVKTTNELLLLRSDVFELTDAGTLHQVVPQLPGVALDEHFRLVDDFEHRVPAPLSLRGATSLKVVGDVSFGSGVQVVGDVLVEATEPTHIADGSVLAGG